MLNVRLMLICCLLLGGCASSKIVNTGNVTRIDGNALPMPSREDRTLIDRPYYLGPFDELTIDVVGISELNQREIQVDASGRLNFPLIGTIVAGGKTPSEVAALIESGLRDRFIRNPQVTVNLKKTVSQVMTIDGEVREPGLYPVVGRMSLLRAVATAKGTTEFAKLDDVVVFRTVSGKTYAALYNLKALRQGAYDDPEIFANDIVIVGDSRARRVFKDFLQILPLLTTPLIVALQ